MPHYIGKVYNLGTTLKEHQHAFNKILQELEKTQKELAQLKKQEIKILIHIEGGVLQGIWASAPIDIHVRDQDNIDAGDEDTTPPEFAALEQYDLAIY